MKRFWGQGISLQIIQGMPLSSLMRVLAGNDFSVDTRYLGRLAYLMGIGVFNSILRFLRTVLRWSRNQCNRT